MRKTKKTLDMIAELGVEMQTVISRIKQIKLRDTTVTYSMQLGVVAQVLPKLQR
jgi:hypothetical protein